jgi:hypothetical protein
MMFMCVYKGLNLFNFIRKHFLQTCLWDVSYVCIYCSFLFIKHARAITIHCSLSVQWLSERTELYCLIFMWWLVPHPCTKKNLWKIHKFYSTLLYSILNLRLWIEQPVSRHLSCRTTNCSTTSCSMTCSTTIFPCTSLSAHHLKYNCRY